MSEKIKDIYIINNYPNKSGERAFCILDVENCSTRELMEVIENSDHHINDIVKHGFIICEITHTGLNIPVNFSGFGKLIVAENKMNRINQKNGYDLDEVERLIIETFRLKKLRDLNHKKWGPVLSN